MLIRFSCCAGVFPAPVRFIFLALGCSRLPRPLCGASASCWKRVCGLFLLGIEYGGPIYLRTSCPRVLEGKTLWLRGHRRAGRHSNNSFGSRDQFRSRWKKHIAYTRVSDGSIVLFWVTSMANSKADTTRLPAACGSGDSRKGFQRSTQRPCWGSANRHNSPDGGI